MENGVAGPRYEQHTTEKDVAEDISQSRPKPQDDSQAGVLDSVATVAAPKLTKSSRTTSKGSPPDSQDHGPPTKPSNQQSAHRRTYAERSQQSIAEKLASLAAQGVTRKPPSSPTLHPAYRYCALDEIIKPLRTHHCKSCGTVSLFFFLL